MGMVTFGGALPATKIWPVPVPTIPPYTLLVARAWKGVETPKNRFLLAEADKFQSQPTLGFFQCIS